VGQAVTWLSIDGGNEAKTDRVCYCARWSLENHLVDVDTWSIEGAQLTAPITTYREGLQFVAVERHQQDGRISGGGGRVPPGIVIDLAWNTAAVAYTLARGAPVHEYTPAVWIGGTAKAVLQQRIYIALTPAERRALQDSWPALHAPRVYLNDNLKRHAVGKPPLKHPYFNVLDAVGVGLFHLGRVGKGAAPIRRAATIGSSK
jgi:hypothetical protein